MTDEITQNPVVRAAASRWSEIDSELKSLEGKSDAASRDRYDELLEALMCADMALKPVKDAMAKDK